jgi:hypothetical protein
MLRAHQTIAALPLILAACSGGDQEQHTLAVPGGDPLAGAREAAGLGTPAAGPGDVFEHSDPGPNESKRFIVEPNQGGMAAQIRLAELAYGRLVDVYGLVGNGRRSFEQRDFLIGPDLVGDGVDYLLETHPGTGDQDLVILRDVRDHSPGGGLEQFVDLLRQAETGLVPVLDQGLPGGPGPWSLWPRNGALMLRFDDLVDAASLDPETVRLMVGDPPAVALEVRLVADRNHGAWTLLSGDASRTFHTTRVLVDPAVNERESFESGMSLPVNWTGLPAAEALDVANLALRVPTQTDLAVGQDHVLVNPTGGPVASTGNGTIDPFSPTLDMVRAARSGGASVVTGDAFEGFLPDHEGPVVLGEISAVLPSAPIPDPLGDAADFVLPGIQFPSAACAEAPMRGASLSQPGFLAVVTSASQPIQGSLARRVHVRLLVGDPDQWPAAAVGPVLYRTPWDSVANAGQEACYVDFFPQEAGWPNAPGRGLHPSSVFGLVYSEPVSAASGAPSDALYLTRRAPDQVDSGYDYVPATVDTVGRGSDLLPALPLSHRLGNAEAYWVGGSDQVVDLAGNPIVDPLPAVEVTLDPAAADEKTGGRVTRFAQFDEDPPFGDAAGPKPEWSGQHLYDLVRGEIRPRPVVHFNRVIDRSQPVPAMMTPFAPGVREPLNPLGAKSQFLWRYADMGYTLSDKNLHNLDVEGLSWSPAFGAVFADSYAEFEIRLSHGRFLPDEYLDPSPLLPMYPQSGLKKKFKGNHLDLAQDPPKVVHPRSAGYTVSPGDLYVSPGGTMLMPFPLNQDVAADGYEVYTWRDTAVRVRAGNLGGGAPLWREAKAYGVPQPSNRYYPGGKVRTEGLPLLMEFRCWPDPGAFGLNSFDVSLASNTSSRPYFRAFSAGGIDENSNVVLVDPDAETHANGGFDPGSNPPGQPTFGLDSVSYIGAVDFVARISRSHSIWFPALEPLAGGTFTAPSYLGVLVEPGAERQPPGTVLEFAYRGLTAFSPPDDSCGGVANNFDALENAMTLDLFGDHYDDNCLQGDLPDHRAARQNKGMTFLGGPQQWQESSDSLAGAVFHQVRVTFISDPATGLNPVLSSLGVGWFE